MVRECRLGKVYEGKRARAWQAFVSALEYPYDYEAYRIPPLIHLRVCTRSAKLESYGRIAWANGCAKHRDVPSRPHGVTAVKSPMLHST
jgi:hypothetical protein